MKFTKMHGIGNDYVYVETFHQPAPADPVQLAVAMSDRHFGIGSDGLILIEPSAVADARMRMFNNDGSEAEMCGNGIRCVAKFIHDHAIARQPRVTVETGRGVLTLDLEVEAGIARRVRVNMGTPILASAAIPTTLVGDPPVDLPIEVAGQTVRVTAVSVGNPHAVIYVADVATWPVETLGPLIERHPSFPRKVNVHFVEVISRGEVRMRTWERGTGITLACGTGACAVAVAGVLTDRTDATLLAHLPGGDLTLEWAGTTDAPVFMTGTATEVFAGEWPDEF